MKFYYVRTIIYFLFTMMAITTEATPTVVIVNFGDGDGGLNSVANSIALYRDQMHFEVRSLPPSNSMKDDLEVTFANLQNVEELIVETYGHGQTVEPLSDSQRFPRLSNRSGGPYASTDNVFLFENGKSLEEAKYKAGIQLNAVGSGDFVAILSNFHTRFPSTPITVFMQQCYSGHAARSLNQIPGVQAYAAASDQREASRLGEQSIGFLDTYHRVLGRMSAFANKMSFSTAFLTARSEWMKYLMDNSDEVELEVPWSPVDAYINNWCDQASPNTNSMALQRPLFQAKDLADDTIAFEQSVFQRIQERLQCQDKEYGAVQEDFVRASRPLLIQGLKSLLTATQGMPETQEKIGPRLKCEEEGKHACAPLTLDPSLFLRERIGPFNIRLGSNCQKSDSNCLISLENVTTDFPFNTTRKILDISDRIQNSGRVCQLRRVDFYRACYNRFWKEADGATKAGLIKLVDLMQTPAINR